MASLISMRGDQSDLESTCSSITVPDSTRSWMSNLSLSHRSSFSTTDFPTPTAANNISTNHLINYNHQTQKPHKANQAAWESIKRLQREKGRIGLEHFKLLRRVGSGDIGNVYLCQIRNPIVSSKPCFYAMKVVDREALAIRKKLIRADMEKEILGMLDHPFLPTLYAEFDASHYSCLVMEYCTGGDLYVLRSRQPSKRFSISTAKFYAAETLLALEYLHMMGIVYRDLKPENVLVREDGHIMLSDFDLSLKCEVVPKLLLNQKLVSSNLENNNIKGCSRTASSYCVTAPIQPVLSCFSLYHPFSSSASKKRRSATVTTTITEHADPNHIPTTYNKDHHLDDDDEVRSNISVSRSSTAGSCRRNIKQQAFEETELIAEPINARSKSFVGTHEYLAPEVISGLGHGSAVDWWTFGVFLYEMIYGKTPFKGENNEKTLVNILKQPLSFPRTINDTASMSAKEYEDLVRVQDLISKLLIKNPKKRIGSLKGSVEIKRHDFFKGVNWALIRSVKPPIIPSDRQRIINGNNANRGASGGGGAILLQKAPVLMSKKQREEPYQIPHHFDYF